MKKVVFLLEPLILSFIGGFLDIYSMTYRGGKFCLLQTGNLIYLARDLINSDYLSVLLILFIFVSFTFGLLIGNSVGYFMKKKDKTKYIHITLLILILLLIIPNYFFSQTLEFDISYIGTFTLSLIGGILVESFRYSYVAYTSTMMTNNYKLLIHELFHGVVEKDRPAEKKAIFYIFIILAFILGVLCYTLCYKYNIISQYIIFVPQVLILILIIIEINVIKKEGIIYEE